MAGCFPVNDSNKIMSVEKFKCLMREMEENSSPVIQWGGEILNNLFYAPPGSGLTFDEAFEIPGKEFWVKRRDEALSRLWRLIEHEGNNDEKIEYCQRLINSYKAKEWPKAKIMCRPLLNDPVTICLFEIAEAYSKGVPCMVCER